MWRREGAGELYTYLPPSAAENKAVCSVAPESDCNDVFGASVGRGSFTFTPGKRTTIGQRVKLNDVGKANGELELFVDGKSMFTVPGLVLRTAGAGRIRGIQMQTFFGGECCVTLNVYSCVRREWLIDAFALCGRRRQVVVDASGPGRVLWRLLGGHHPDAVSTDTHTPTPPSASAGVIQYQDHDQRAATQELKTQMIHDSIMRCIPDDASDSRLFAPSATLKFWLSSE